ncbi:MAG: hypothetical protein IPL10_12430 [Bacteroidetes bacterium]|nr:hypothetical protein [Bacteroidota bacterium]
MYQDYKRALTILAVLFFTSKPILAQNWADIGFSYSKDPGSTPPRVLFSEYDSTKLYVGGNFINFNSSVTHGLLLMTLLMVGNNMVIYYQMFKLSQSLIMNYSLVLAMVSLSGI